MKLPQPGMVIEIQVGLFQEHSTRVIGVVRTAVERWKKLKYFEPGLYVEFEKVLWVSQRWDDVAYHPVMPFFALKGEWREVAEDEVLGRVL
jgi:hypothetical protein